MRMRTSLQIVSCAIGLVSPLPLLGESSSRPPSHFFLEHDPGEVSPAARANINWPEEARNEVPTHRDLPAAPLPRQLAPPQRPESEPQPNPSDIEQPAPTPSDGTWIPRDDPLESLVEQRRRERGVPYEKPPPAATRDEAILRHRYLERLLPSGSIAPDAYQRAWEHAQRMPAATQPVSELLNDSSENE